jgi:hypothetical protein
MSFYSKAILKLKSLSIKQWQLVFSGIMATATFAATFSAIFAGVQLWLTHRDLVVTQTPWMGVSLVHVKSVSLDLKDPKASYHVQLKNFGVSPATHVTLSSRPIVRADQFYVTRQLTCQEAQNVSNARTILPSQGITIENTGGGIVFPGQESFADFTNVRIERPDFDASRFFYIVGCIVYRDSFNEIHDTKFIYASDVDVSSITGPIELKPFVISESPR